MSAASRLATKRCGTGGIDLARYSRLRSGEIEPDVRIPHSTVSLEGCVDLNARFQARGPVT